MTKKSKTNSINSPKFKVGDSVTRDGSVTIEILEVTKEGYVYKCLHNENYIRLPKPGDSYYPGANIKHVDTHFRKLTKLEKALK